MPMDFILSFQKLAVGLTQLRYRHTLFQFRRNHKFLCCRIVLDTKQVRSATYLAVFDIALPAASRLVHRRLVGLATTRALESGLHDIILTRRYPFTASCFMKFVGQGTTPQPPKLPITHGQK